MNIVYLVTDQVTGLKYIGSKKNYKGNYFGSPSIKSKGHPKYKLQQEWKKNLKERPESFKFEIIEEIIEDSKKALNERELYWQLHYKVVNSNEFINGAYARKNFNGIPKGFKRDKNRIEYLKSIGTWKTTEEQKEKIRQKQTGKKYSDEINKKKGRPGVPQNQITNVQVIVDGVLYRTLTSASEALNCTRCTVRNRCNNPKFPNYNFHEDKTI